MCLVTEEEPPGPEIGDNLPCSGALPCCTPQQAVPQQPPGAAGLWGASCGPPGHALCSQVALSWGESMALGKTKSRWH